MPMKKIDVATIEAARRGCRGPDDYSGLGLRELSEVCIQLRTASELLC